MNMPLVLFLGFGMTIAAVNDFRTGKIPNLLTFPMILFGIIYHSVMSGWNGLGFSFGGLIVGLCIFLVPYGMGAMGAGDAKLLGAAGAFLGPKGTIIVAVICVLLGLIYAMTLLVVHRTYARSFLQRCGITIKTLFLTRQFIPIPPEEHEKQPLLRFALPIALGTIIYIYLKLTGSNLIQDFLGFQFSL
jgi:prepilin peptidase CpaA